MQKTIIAVEDDPYYQKYYGRMLSKKYNFISMFNGAEAIQAVEQHQPDLLILDMDIPGKTGRSIVIEVKKVNKEVPIIIVSSKSGIKSDPEIEMSKQIRRFFEKPAKFKEILEAIDIILEQPKSSPHVVSWIGKKVLGCNVEELIGSGGSGSVFRGTRFDKHVALKFINIQNGLSAERFRRELLSMAKIQHPNIVHFFDAQEVVPGIFCVVMDYFSGNNLQDYVNNEAFELSEAIFIVNEISEGLKAAHAEKIVHRDIKPSNVMYNREDKKVKLIDFGIIKDMDQFRITDDGQAVGTPMYMSPEQCTGQSADHRCDIYSLGAVFYHLLVGNPPFLGESIFNTMRAQIEDDVVWPCDVDIPDSIRAIVEKMMEKKPEDRFQSIAEFQQALTEHTA